MVRRVRGLDLPDEFLLGQGEGLAVAALAPFTRIGAWLGVAVARPLAAHVGPALRIVADHYDGHVGSLGRLHRRSGLVGGGVVHGHPGSDGVADALEGRDGPGRRAAVPVPVDDVGHRADDRDGLQRVLAKRQSPAAVLQQDDRFERHRPSRWRGAPRHPTAACRHGSWCRARAPAGSSRPSFRVTRNFRRSASSRSASVTEPSLKAARSSSL